MLKLSICLALALSLLAGCTARAQDKNFAQWLVGFKENARSQGVSQKTIEQAFDGMEPDERVVALDQKQPENKVTLTQYLANTITRRRIAKGKAMMVEHRATLKKISARYGVQPQYIVALWGIESDFGRNKGNFSVVRSLTTLAYEGRRADFFGKELMAALTILDKEHMRSDELLGSWAGAMGDCQFMPSTYLNYAADGNGDGHRNIWHSPPDVFASIASYLHALQWDTKQDWGKRITVPANFTPADADIAVGKTATEWNKLGLVYAKNKKSPMGQQLLYAMYPGTEEEGAFLVTTNYKALLQWNRSRYFATAVGTLADAIKERP